MNRYLAGTTSIDRKRRSRNSPNFVRRLVPLRARGVGASTFAGKVAAARPSFQCCGAAYGGASSPNRQHKGPSALRSGQGKRVTRPMQSQGFPALVVDGAPIRQNKQPGGQPMLHRLGVIVPALLGSGRRFPPCGGLPFLDTCLPGYLPNQASLRERLAWGSGLQRCLTAVLNVSVLLLGKEEDVLKWTHGPSLEDPGTRFRLWAPGENRVELEIEGLDSVAMERVGSGFSETLVEGFGQGGRYMFALSGGQRVPDPASRFQPEDVGGPSEVIDPLAYCWREILGWPGMGRGGSLRDARRRLFSGGHVRWRGSETGPSRGTRRHGA